MRRYSEMPMKELGRCGPPVGKDSIRQVLVLVQDGARFSLKRDVPVQIMRAQMEVASVPVRP